MNYLRKLILKNKNELLGKININKQRMNFLSKLILLRKNELLPQIKIKSDERITSSE